MTQSFRLKKLSGDCDIIGLNESKLHFINEHITWNKLPLLMIIFN